MRCRHLGNTFICHYNHKRYFCVFFLYIYIYYNNILYTYAVIFFGTMMQGAAENSAIVLQLLHLPVQSEVGRKLDRGQNIYT